MYAWSILAVRIVQPEHVPAVQHGLVLSPESHAAKLRAQAEAVCCLPLCCLSCAQDVLSDLPAELEFLIIIAAYKNSQKPGFVPPSINNRELDLYTVRKTSPWSWFPSCRHAVIRKMGRSVLLQQGGVCRCTLVPAVVLLVQNAFSLKRAALLFCRCVCSCSWW
jgi:hypothetical protein